MTRTVTIAFVCLTALFSATPVLADCSLWPGREAQCRAERAAWAAEERRMLEERRRAEEQQRRDYERQRWEQQQRELDREALREAACTNRGGRWSYGQCL